MTWTWSLLRNYIMRFSVLGFKRDKKIELQTPVVWTRDQDEFEDQVEKKSMIYQRKWSRHKRCLQKWEVEIIMERKIEGHSQHWISYFWLAII